MEYLFIYLLQLSDVIRVMAKIALVLVALGGFAWLVAYCDGEVEEAGVEKVKSFIIKTSIISLILFIIPTNQTLLLLGGTYLGEKAVKQVITNERMKKIDTIINLELDKRIKELKSR